MEIDSLCDAIVDRGLDAVELTRRALVFARERAEEVREVELGGDLAPAQTVGKELSASFGAEPILIDLSVRVRARVASILRAAATPTRPEDERGLAGYVAHRLALELEERFGSQFFPQLSPGGPRLLGPDDLLLQPSPFTNPEGAFRRHYSGRLSSNPTNLGRRGLDRLKARGRLMPPAPRDLRVRWTPTWSAALDDLEPDSLVVAITPVAHFQDLEAPPLVSTPGGPRFFGVRPKEPERVEAAALELVRKADAAGASIVVLPEVCATRGGVEAVATWIEEHAASIRIAVCGSYHDDVVGLGRRNVAIVTRGQSSPAERIAVHKIVPFKRNEDEALEDIAHADPIIDVVAGCDWSMVTQICIDFFDETLASFVVELGPSLVLVPACSSTTDTFATVAQNLVMRTQAHVVMSNQNVDPRKAYPSPFRALIARPSRTHTQVVQEKPADSVAMPRAHATRLGDVGGTGWVELT